MKHCAYLLLSATALALPSPAHATTWHVPSQCPTIQAGIDSASTGDTVLVACGTYYESSIDMKSGICLRSQTGLSDCVVIDAGGASCVICCEGVDDSAIIEGLTLTGGVLEIGGGMFCVSSSPRITNCAFRENCACYEDGGGMYCTWWSSPTLNNCTFSENTALWAGGGMTCTEQCSPTLVSCTFVGNVANWGGAIRCMTSSHLTLVSCTFCDNAAGAISCTWQSSVVIRNSVIGFNHQGCAVTCSHGGTAALTCCDIYGNEGGDWVGCIENQLGVNGNISEDPLFCDDCLYLQECSPCVYGYGCGQMGAYGVGCPCGGGPTGVEHRSWSSLKSLYR